MTKRVVSLLLCSILILGCLMASGCAPAAGPKDDGKLKVAMVCSGAINDGSWNTSGYNALMAVKEKYGADTAYSEQVSIDELPTVLRSYGREGYDVIIAHSMEYDEQMKRVAPEFPNTAFVTVNGFSTGDNLYAVQFKYWELQYFMGLAAALASQNGKIGVIHAMDTAMVKLEKQAMEQGAAFVNPACTVEYSFTGDWNDLAKAKEASLAQIDNGADVLLANVSSCVSAIFGACEERGVYGMGWGDDVTSLAPDTVLICGLFDLKDLYNITVQKIQDGEQEKALFLTIKDGALGTTPMASWMPEDKRKVFEDRWNEYMNGGFEIEVDGEL